VIVFLFGVLAGVGVVVLLILIALGVAGRLSELAQDRPAAPVRPVEARRRFVEQCHEAGLDFRANRAEPEIADETLEALQRFNAIVAKDNMRLRAENARLREHLAGMEPAEN